MRIHTSQHENGIPSFPKLCWEEGTSDFGWPRFCGQICKWRTYSYDVRCINYGMVLWETLPKRPTMFRHVVTMAQLGAPLGALETGRQLSMHHLYSRSSQGAVLCPSGPAVAPSLFQILWVFEFSFGGHIVLNDICLEQFENTQDN